MKGKSFQMKTKKELKPTKEQEKAINDFILRERPHNRIIKLNNGTRKIVHMFSLDVLKKTLHKWWYFEDDEIIDLVFANMISEKIRGDPLWSFLIAPPGALKTELLRAFTNEEYFYQLSNLTSRTFVSGLMLGSGKKRRKIKDLLPELNGKVLIFKDFTTILEKGREERREIISQLREIYDQEIALRFGTMDEAVRYKSRFGLIAGVTPIIDKHWKIMQQLGERFLKFRWDENIDRVTTRARKMAGKEKIMRKEISEAITNFSNWLFGRIKGSLVSLSKNKQIRKREIVIPKFNEEKYGEEIENLAKFIAISRTPLIVQDYRTDFYFDFIPMPERPTRLVKQLKKLAICLALIRQKFEVDDEEMKTLRRVSKDTIPQDRLVVLEAIKTHNEGIYGCSSSSIGKFVKIPQSSIDRVLQQLELLDLVVKTTIQEDRGTIIKHNFYRLNEKNTLALTSVTFTVRGSKSHLGVLKDLDFTKTGIKEELEGEKNG